jgi:hypothetical protein
VAFGISRQELKKWKEQAARGEIAFLTHYWVDPRFPGIRTVTKVGCADVGKLADWCRKNGLNPRYIHMRDDYPHFDLLGPEQKKVLMQEGLRDHIERFRL